MKVYVSRSSRERGRERESLAQLGLANEWMFQFFQSLSLEAACAKVRIHPAVQQLKLSIQKAS